MLDGRVVVMASRHEDSGSPKHRVVVVDSPVWPILAAGLDPSRAVAVVEGGRIVACGIAARVAGVRLGMGRREAQACCPTLALLARDERAEARAFGPVVEVLESVAVGVVLLRPGRCFLQAGAPARYYGGEQALLRALSRALRSPGLPGTSLSGAGLPGTGLPGVGRSGVGFPQAAPPAGPVGFDPAETDSVHTWGPWRYGIAEGVFAAEQAARQGRIVPEGESAAFLAELPVEALPDAVVAQGLRRVGLRRLGQFAALPVDRVIERFGTAGVTAHRLALGHDACLPAPRPPGLPLGVRVQLDPPALHAEQVSFAARGVAETLAERLGGAGLVCTRLQIEVEGARGRHQVRPWRRDDGFGVSAMIERVRWQLEGWVAAGGAQDAVVALVLEAAEVALDQGRQAALWGQPSEADRRATRAIARLQGLVGHEHVVHAQVVGGRDPIDRVRLHPVEEAGVGVGGFPAGHRSAEGKKREGAAPWPGRLPTPSPSVVPSEPLGVQVCDVQGEAVAVSGRGVLSAAPSRVRVETARSWSSVVAWAGPWPVEERWWDAVAQRRRARMQVVIEDGTGWLLVLERGCWWIEGTYR